MSANDTALVITDPQNDFLSEDGVTWGLVGGSVTENKTVQHIGQLLSAAKEKGYEVFVSPHYYYPTDKGWKFGGTVEKMMHEINMFGRQGALSLATTCKREHPTHTTQVRSTTLTGELAVQIATG